MLCIHGSTSSAPMETALALRLTEPQRHGSSTHGRRLTLRCSCPRFAFCGPMAVKVRRPPRERPFGHAVIVQFLLCSVRQSLG
jgi:hypothetical protein